MFRALPRPTKALRPRSPADPHPSRRGPILAFLSVLQLLIAVDVTVVTIALPSIGTDFGAGAGALTWVVTGYTVVGGGLLLMGGRICDLVGRRRMFLAGAALFGAASLLAGLAPSLPVLVAARFAQGAGEALASPAAMSLIALLFPETRARARALGVWAAISSGGLVAGVLLSGVLTELAHWRWIFLVNPPLVLAVVIACPLLIRPDPPRARPDIDPRGPILLTVAPVALILGIVRAGELPWAEVTVWGPVLLGLLAFGVFAALESRTTRPLVPRGVLRDRIRLTANLATALLSAALSATFFLSTLYLQDVLRLPPLQAGLAFLPFCVVLLLAISQVARLVDRLGVRWTAVLGIGCTAAGTAWLSRLPAEGTLWADLMPGMLAVAAGMGVGLVALQNAALHGVTETDAGVAAGVQRCVDQLGGATGLAVFVGAAFTAAAGGEVEGYRAAFRLALAGLVVAGVGFGLLARPRATG
ncbi:MFS transporter [Amycolatopsis antarctica]|uniref:MFS transporter n=1 Tax=Amycolatopsis antarctica TaxID=1854586 RepID=A0A263CYL5_9PSEU|nr:MFS transporter [Amycolatopsis antarctica]OZM71201.1 MFS transporter [Amycolatopsis antarctica]